MHFGIGIENFKKDVNMGTLFRTAYNLNAGFIFTIGKPYTGAKGDTVRSGNHIPIMNFDSVSHMKKTMSNQYAYVGIEIQNATRDLLSFDHPKKAVYVLGNESIGLSEETASKCDAIVSIPSQHCMNVSVCGGVVMYDRLLKNRRTL